MRTRLTRRVASSDFPDLELRRTREGCDVYLGETRVLIGLQNKRDGWCFGVTDPKFRPLPPVSLYPRLAEEARALLAPRYTLFTPTAVVNEHQDLYVDAPLRLALMVFVYIFPSRRLEDFHVIENAVAEPHEHALIITVDDLGGLAARVNIDPRDFCSWCSRSLGSEKRSLGSDSNAVFWSHANPECEIWQSPELRPWCLTAVPGQVTEWLGDNAVA
jgi:hypothetical protein